MAGTRIRNVDLSNLSSPRQQHLLQQRQLVSLTQMLSRSMAQAADLASGLEESHSQLGRIGSRLPALRSKIAPLQEKSELAARADRNIDAAVEAAGLALERLQRLEQLEGSVEGGDPRRDLDGYLAAVAALEVESAAGCGEEEEKKRLALVEVAASKLEVEFQRLVGECSSVCDCNPSERSKRTRRSSSSGGRKKGELEQDKELAVVALQGDQTLDKLQKIVKTMAVLVAGGLDKCVSIYQRERIEKLRLKSSLVDWILRNYSRSARSLQDDEQEQLVVEWNGHLEASITIVYMAEMDFCSKIFGDVLEPWEVNECLARIAGPSGMNTLLDFGELFVRWDRQQQQQPQCLRPDKLFKLLDMYETLQGVGVAISQQLFAGQGECSTQLRTRSRELHKLAVDAASKLFSGFKNQLRSIHQSEHYVADLRPPRDAGVDKLSSYVLSYVKAVTSDSYAQAMEQVLRIEQSWKNANSTKPGLVFQQPQQLLLEKALVEMISSLEDALAAKCKKWYKDPAQQHIFLMNNAYFVFTRLKKIKLAAGHGHNHHGQQQNGRIKGGSETIRQVALSDSWLKDRRSKVQEHALAYQKEGWGKVLGQLSRQGLFLVSGAEAARQLVKQRLDGFAAALEETCLRHRGIGIPDQELRDATRAAVVHNIVPAYRSYLQSYGALIDSSCLRYSAGEVEKILTRLFGSMPAPCSMKNTTNTNTDHIAIGRLTVSSREALVEPAAH